MTELAARRVLLAAFIILCLAGTIYRTWEIRGWGDQLSAVDPHSESSVLREVDGFRAQGLTHDSGLGNVLFGPRYPDVGFAGPLGEDLKLSVTPSGVYTHYPPGPEYLTYIAEAVFGPEPVSHLRLLPLALCGAAAVFYGLSLRSRFGDVAAWLVMLASLGVVSFSDANSSVHMLGYALAFLLVEIGVAIELNCLRAPFFLLGFLQGWISFDWVFLVVLTPLAVELSLPLISLGYKARLRLAFERGILAAAGFTFAHLLHFAEVWSFYGSFSDAVADLRDSAKFRFSGDDSTEAIAGAFGRLRLLAHYIFSQKPIVSPFGGRDDVVPIHRSFRFLGLTLGALWPLVATVLGAIDVIRWRRGLPALGLLWRWFFIGLIGLAASCVWYVAMPAHSFVHRHLLYRHLILCFELWAIFLAVLAAGPIERWLAGKWPSLGIGAKSALARDVAKSEVM